MIKFISNQRDNQNGNVFFALFGAVAFVGVLGAATMSFMKGPLKTSVTLSRMSVADTQMQVAAQMAVLQASTESDSGDCDADTFVEPIEWKVQANNALRPLDDAGTGGAGGNIPDTLGATKQDPWGMLYGYCVWNNGSVSATHPNVGSNAACDDDGSGTEDRLQGSPMNYDVVMAIVSAGADRTFQTTCRTFAEADNNTNGSLGDVGDDELISKASGSDDVILTYTYAEAAMVGGGGLWSIKSSDPGTATIDKAIEFTGGLTMGTEIDVTVCSLDTLNQMRYNGVTDVIQVCDGTSWVDMSGGGATPAGNETELQFNTGGALDADSGLTYDATNDALTIDGSVTIGATTDADLPVLISNASYSNAGIFELDSGVVRNSGDHTTEDFVFGSPQLADSGDADHDNRFWFDKSRGAFRAGGVTGTYWDDSSVGDYSVAMGISRAGGNYSTALGDSNASGNYTIAGGNSTASAIYSASFGAFNTSSGVSAFTAGTSNRATQHDSFAIGLDNDAIADHAFALGTETIVSGTYSAAFGLGDQTATYPTVSGGNSFGIFMGDQSGVDVTSSNVMVIMGGDLGIENSSPDVELDVTGDIEYSGTITDVSDIRMKENVAPLENSLEKVTSLEGISFTMKEDEEGKTEYGFSAQDVQKVYPELVKTAEDEMGSLSMNYVGLIAPLVESVKELKAENEELRADLEAMKNQAGHSDTPEESIWLYVLLGLLGGMVLSNICRHACCRKKEG